MYAVPQPVPNRWNTRLLLQTVLWWITLFIASFCAMWGIFWVCVGVCIRVRVHVPQCASQKTMFMRVLGVEVDHQAWCQAPLPTKPSYLPKWGIFKISILLNVLKTKSFLVLVLVFCCCSCCFVFLFCFVLFWRQGFSVALERILELALIHQAGLELTEIRLPLPPECWD